MTGFKDDLLLGLSEVADLGWLEITYNGLPIMAKIGSLRERQPFSARHAVGDEMTIVVQRTDVPVFTRGVPVLVDGETWRADRRTGCTQFAMEILLIANQQNIPRRKSF